MCAACEHASAQRFPNWKSHQLVLINYNQRKRRGRNRIPHRSRRRVFSPTKCTIVNGRTLLCGARLDLFACGPSWGSAARSSIIVTPAASGAQKAHAVSRNSCDMKCNVSHSGPARDMFYDPIGTQAA